jgi:hypothetical protein
MDQIQTPSGMMRTKRALNGDRPEYGISKMAAMTPAPTTIPNPSQNFHAEVL